MPFGRARVAGLTLVIVAAAGCGSPPSADKQIETLQSWTATMTLAADERRAAAISQRYARGLADVARDARGETARGFDAAHPPAPERVRAGRALDSLDVAIARLAALNGSR
jgi:hypothetical protein